jgi:hypothetical protein
MDPDAKIGKVYKLTNSVNSKYYVGSTTQKYLSNRLCTHKNDAKNKRRPGNVLHMAMLETGIDTWKIEQIGSLTYTSVRELRRFEDQFVELADENCLNAKKASSIYVDEYKSKDDFEKARYQVNKETDKIRSKKRWEQTKLNRLNQNGNEK